MLSAPVRRRHGQSFGPGACDPPRSVTCRATEPTPIASAHRELDISSRTERNEVLLRRADARQGLGQSVSPVTLDGPGVLVTVMVETTTVRLAS